MLTGELLQGLIGRNLVTGVHFHPGVWPALGSKIEVVAFDEIPK